MLNEDYRDMLHALSDEKWTGGGVNKNDISRPDPLSSLFIIIIKREIYEL